jgi:hypothetical protein
MEYRIKAGQYQWLVVSHTLALVRSVVRRMAEDFPVETEFEIFCGRTRVAAYRRHALFDPMQPDLTA